MPPRIAPVISQPDTDSALYIHPSEGPNSINVIPKLTGPNYLAWSRSMKRALGAKNKLSFIDGTMAIPAPLDLNRAQWERGNYLVYSWILNSVTDPIASTIVFHDNAIDVWLDLQERFSKADRIRVATLRNSLNNLKQGTKSVLDYFTEMKSLWEELNSHRPLPNCTCVHPCRCPAMQLVRTYRLEDQVIQFLTGLNDSFSVVKTQVLLMDPLPGLNKVYSLVVQEENNHPPLPSIDESSSLINAAQKFANRGKGTSNGGGKNNSKYCTFSIVIIMLWSSVIQNMVTLAKEEMQHMLICPLMKVVKHPMVTLRRFIQLRPILLFLKINSISSWLYYNK
jgi:hypothetical protein